MTHGDDGDRPVLALLAAPGTAARAVPLLGLLGLHAEVVSWQRRGERVPAALLATSVAALAAADGPLPAHVGVWVKHHDQVDAARAAGATVLLTADPELVPRGALLVPPIGIEVDRWPAVAPLVRRRRRARLGLPDDHVLRVEGRLDPADDGRELACAAAVVASGPVTLVALALGTPVVTSTDTARRLGLRPGRDVVVAADPDEAMAEAHAIAGDDARAASLSRRARRCAEHHLDLGRPARAVAEALHLVAPAPEASFRLGARLDELGTPVGAPIRARATGALAALVPDGGGSSS